MTNDDEPVIHQGVATLTLRQLDRACGATKGTSFRTFKQLRGELREGADFFHLRAEAHGELIERLRARGTVYPSTVHLLLLGPRASELIREHQRSDGDG